jgi:hypothetical protein
MNQINTKTVSLDDIIKFHTNEAKACEQGVHALSNANLKDQYAQRAEWHRQAVERIHWIIRQAAP